jgi:hypothetical protein
MSCGGAFTRRIPPDRSFLLNYRQLWPDSGRRVLYAAVAWRMADGLPETPEISDNPEAPGDEHSYAREWGETLC